MRRVLDIRPVARDDVDQYVAYMGLDSPATGYRFLAAAESTFEKIAAWPGIGRPREFADGSLLGMRSCPIDGFPNHLVFYRLPDDSSVAILRVRHGAMDADAIDMGE